MEPNEEGANPAGQAQIKQSGRPPKISLSHSTRTISSVPIQPGRELVGLLMAG